MITRCLIAAGLALFFGTTTVSAETCGGFYRVQSGDTLSQIADVQYKDARKWSVIFQNNLSVIGNNPNNIKRGSKLELACIGGLPLGLEGGKAQASVAAEPTKSAVVASSTTASAAVQVAAVNRKIKLLTADDYAPFTDRKLPGGGMITEMVTAALNSNSDVKDFGIYVVNDWAAHLDPLLTDAVLDLGYPWFKPDCDAMPDSFRCSKLNFSEPMFEVLMLLFQWKDRPFEFNSDKDMEGKTLCRPKGYLTHDLEGNGRNWVSKGLVKVVNPNTVADCYELLEKGEVDAVSLSDFVGRAAIKDLGIVDKVRVVETRPLSIEGLYVVVGKNHPQADEMLELINTGLANIKKSGAYQQILDTHMSRIWSEF